MEENTNTPNIPENDSVLETPEDSSTNLLQGGPSTTTISERKARKLVAKQLRQENFLYHRKLKRKEQRERQKSKRKALAESVSPDLGIPPKMFKMSESECRIRVVVECSHDSLMTEKDIGKLYNQLNHCYGMNRRAVNPLQYYITDIGPKLFQKMISIAENMNDIPRWDVHIHRESFLQLFPRDEIVYLAAESDVELTELSDDKVYIIGGLVDHNHHKGLCFAAAQGHKVSTARLPLSQHVTLNSRAILAVPHVFDILLRYSLSHDWNESILAAVPKRKLTNVI